MLRRLTCLFILLSFLLIKGSSLLVAERLNQSLTTYTLDKVAQNTYLGQSDEELSTVEDSDNENKETKFLEFGDDEYFHCSLTHLPPAVFSKRINLISFPDIAIVHLSLLSPPPNQEPLHSSANA